MNKKSKSRLYDIIENIYTSGMHDQYGIEIKRKVIFLNIFITIGLVLLIPFGFAAYLNEQYLLMIIDFGIAALIVPIAFHIRMTHRTEFAIYTTITLLSFLFIYLFGTGGVHKSGILWLYMYPIFVMLFLGTRNGSFFTLFFLAIILLIHFFPDPVFPDKVYSDEKIYRFIASYLSVFVISFFYEKVKSSTTQDLQSKNERLRSTIEKLEDTKLELKSNERFLDDILNSINNGLCVLDKNFEIKRINKWVEKNYAKRSDVTDKKCFDVFQGRKDICPWCPAKDTMITGKTAKSLIPYQNEEEKERWLEVTSYPLYDDDNSKITGVIEFMQDVTEQKITEENLKKNQANLKALIDNTKDLIWSVNENYEIQIYNMAMKSMHEMIYGITVEDGINILGAGMPAREVEKWKTYYERALNGEQFSIEETIELSEDNPIHMLFSFNPMVSSDGATIGVSCLGRDITTWKEYERSILESEREYRLLFSNAHDAIIIFDPNDERVLDLNDRAAEMYGYDKADMLGNSLKEISKNITSGEKHIKDLLKYKKPLSFQTTQYHKDGHEMVVEVNSSLVTYKGEKAILSINRDVTDRINIEKELKENEEIFRTLSDESPNMIFIIQNGLIVYANKKCEEVTEFSRDELLDNDFDFIDIVHKDSVEQVLEDYNKLYINKMDIPPREYKIVTKKGKTIEVINSSKLIKYNDEDAILGIVTDIGELKRTQKALAQSEKRYKDLFESAEDSRLIMHDTKIIQCNTKSTELLDHSKQELVNKDLYDFAPVFQENERSSEEIIKERVYEVNNAIPQHFEWDIKRKDGKIIKTDITLKKLEAFGDKFHQAVIRDITDRKRNEAELENYRNNLEEIVKYRTDELSKANNKLYQEIYERKQTELALRESEEHFKDLVEKAGIAIMMDNKDGEITYYNTKFCELFGYIPEEMERLTIKDIVHPDDIDTVIEKHIKRMSGERVATSYEFKGIRKDGTEIIVEVKAEPSKIGDSIIGTRSYLWDITKRKEIENQLLISDQILQKAGTLVLVANDKAEMIYASPYFKTVLGFEPDEVLGDNWWRLYDSSPEKIEKEKEYVSLAARGIVPVREAYEKKIKTKDGKEKWIQWQDARGTNKTLIGVGLDITDRKKAILMMKNAKDEAETANKMKSQFIANVSHEIRTPLNGIIGFTELILNSNEVEKIHPQAQSIIRESETLLNLINDLLDHAKMESGKIELEYLPMDLYAFFDDLVSSNYIKIKNKNLDLNVNLDENVPQYVKGDYLRLRQIMMNFISNSIKFTDDGFIEIGMEHIETKGNISQIAFFCTDTGIGIPQEKQESIFESFIQADGSTTRKYGGTGLGTSISKLLVELMGGTIGLDSELGKGSAFWFVVPMEHSEPPIEKEKDIHVTDEIQYVLAEERKMRSSKILVVEDYEPNQEVVRTHLESVGHQVELASNGAIGVEYALEDHYDLILMDIQMPVMDGLSAARAIREKEGPNQNTNIIALTANADDETLKMTSESGMNDLITKPIRRKEFLKVIDKWLFLRETDEEKIEIEPETKDEPEEIKKTKDKESTIKAKYQNELYDLPIVIDVVLDEFGNREVVDKVIEQFMENVARQIDILRDSINEKDYEKVRREAHSIKGGAATLEANPLSLAAKDIEFACKEKNYDKLPELYEKFYSEYERLNDFIKNL